MKRNKFLISLFAIISTLFVTSCDVFKKTEIKLNTSDVELNLAELDEKIFQLEPEIVNGDSKEYTFGFSSDNYEIASVTNKGLITGKEVGEANVKVYLKELPSISSFCKVNVVNELRVKVVLSETEREVYKGYSFSLTATVKNATNREVSWSSENESIATVTEQGRVTISEAANIGDTCKIIATSKEDATKYATCLLTVGEKPSYDYDYTIMMYMSASTLEYSKSYGSDAYQPKLMSQDLKEFLRLSYPEEMKVIIETGGTKKWYMESNFLVGATSISKDKLQRWEVVPSNPYIVEELNEYGRYVNVTYHSKLSLVSTLSSNHIADESEFEGFLEWGISNYRGRQTGVIISGHGGGNAGCAYDDNYSSNCLDTTEITTAVKTAFDNTGVNRLTWMGFDCCLMGVIDIASVLSDYFDYMVCSQETEGGQGWDHDSWVPEIIKNTYIEPEDLLPKITSTFVEEEHSSCGYTYDGQKYYCYATLSSINLKEFSTFVNSFNSFVNEVGTDRNAYSKYKSAFNECYLFFGDGSYGLVDFERFLVAMKDYTSVSSDDVLTSFKKTVVSNDFCNKYPDDPCGLSLFMPINVSGSYLSVSKNVYGKSLSTKFLEWKEMCLVNW